MVNRKNVQWKRWGFTSLIAIFFVYFTYHLFQGERGVLSMLSLKRELAKDKELLAEKEKKKNQLKHQVHLLHPDSLDLDMLEERARVVLNYAYPDEIVTR